MWKNHDTHSLLVGMKNSTATMEDSSAVSYKTTLQALPIRTNHHTPSYLPKRTENKNNLCMDVYSFIPNCQKLEAIKMPFSSHMDKSIVVHRDNEMLFSTKSK